MSQVNNFIKFEILAFENPRVTHFEAILCEKMRYNEQSQSCVTSPLCHSNVTGQQYIKFEILALENPRITHFEAILCDKMRLYEPSQSCVTSPLCHSDVTGQKFYQI